MTTSVFSQVVIAMLLLASVSLFAQAPAPALKPPVGVPADAKHFKGKWYKIILEKGGWKRAREKTAQLGGQLAIVPDGPTNAFLKNLNEHGLQLWLGATDEKVEGLWQWVDGSTMKFKAFDRGQPSNSYGGEHYLELWGKDGRWNDGGEGDRYVVGFICEWRHR